MNPYNKLHQASRMRRRETQALRQHRKDQRTINDIFERVMPLPSDFVLSTEVTPATQKRVVDPDFQIVS